MARYYLIAGESSGDMHGANLMKAIRHYDPAAECRFWGGDRMLAAGGEMVKHIRELAFMGFWEVITNIRTIWKNIQLCRRDIRQYKPDVLVLIDYPGFNLRMARFAKSLGIPVVYYISPQVWAWKASRVHTIRRQVDRMLVILPFEQEFYGRYGMAVDFVGHPLMDELAPSRIPEKYAGFREANKLPGKDLVALLPGSRRQEIQRMLRQMIVQADFFPDHHFVVAGVSGQDRSLYTAFTGRQNVSVVYDQTYALLHHARAALVASGTATLETALFDVPQVVCYKANKLSYHIARRLVKIKYISLVNLIMDRPVLTELIQKDFNSKTLRNHLHMLLYDEACRDAMKQDYAALAERLGGEGASLKAARLVVDTLHKP